MNSNTPQQVIERLGIIALNPMQEASMEAITQQDEVILISPTGSGKTIAFLLPLLQLLTEKQHEVQALVVTPTRELALQIEQVWKKMMSGYKVTTCYGGHNISIEINNLSQAPTLIIGTPGRIADHLERKSFDASTVQFLFLDEFDKSLELGFHDTMDYIYQQLPNLRKKVLISATDALEIPDFVQINNPYSLNFSVPEEKATQLSLKLVISEEKDKINRLFELICSLNSEAALIFCNHREATERIHELLKEKGIYSDFYHGGMDQDDRERALIQFRNQSNNYLITTDLAARGLDIPEMKHVIHYHLPQKEEEFVHRNGRTARMLASGTAYVLVSRDEFAPDYIPNLPEMVINNSLPLPQKPDFQTLYVSGGKKHKLRKMDIVGFFLQEGKLDKDDLGLIEVKDFISFVAVKMTAVKSLLQNLKDKKMKGKKYKIEIARKPNREVR